MFCALRHIFLFFENIFDNWGIEFAFKHIYNDIISFGTNNEIGQNRFKLVD